MERFAIVVDSSADLTQKQYDAMHIDGFIPLSFSIDGKEYFAYPDERELTAEQLSARMTALSKAEHNFVARAVPLIFKDMILWAADTYNESYMAGSISNIGKIDLPRAAKPFVHRFDVFVSTDKLQACVCSFGSELTVSFTSAFVSTNVQKDFFRQLTQAGIQVEIQSNRLEDDIQ